VQAIARALGIDEAHGAMLPQDKSDYVLARQKEGRVVAMVGDGINDAPALALADVGISLGGSTEVALETADVVLLEGGLQKLALAFRTADDTMRRVRRSLGIVIAPNAFAMGLGALGLVGPGVASILNNGSTVLAALTALSPIVKKRGAE
jgi:Cu2+-exporting ATPase